MKRDELMIIQLREVFPERNVVPCLDSRTNPTLNVIEAKITTKNNKIVKPSIYQEPSNNLSVGFRIRNPTQKPIHLLAVDDCFFYSNDPTRCDCIIFDDFYFCFLELKLDVEEFKQRSQKAKEARQQLGTMIEFIINAFRDANKDFLQYEVEAYIVMQQDKYPRRSTKDVNIAERFFTQYRVALFEKNEKEF